MKQCKHKINEALCVSYRPQIVLQDVDRRNQHHHNIRVQMMMNCLLCTKLRSTIAMHNFSVRRACFRRHHIYVEA